MRVLSVLKTYPPVFSGEARFWIRMIPRLTERGFQVDVLCEGPEGGVLLHEASGQVKAWGRRAWPGKGSYLQYVVSVVQTLVKSRNRYEAVMFHGPNEDAFYASAACRPVLASRVIYKMTMFGGDDPIAVRESGRFGRCRLRLLLRADAVVSISPAMTDSALRAGVRAERLWEIPQAADLARFAPAGPAAKVSIRLQEGIPPEAPVVLFVGALVERKGIDLLLKAWPTVVREHPRALLVMTGPPGDRESSIDDSTFAMAMKGLANAPECRGSVRFLGFRPDIERIFQAADIFVLPSRAEGFPSVVAEAMATGLPCILSNLPGVARAAIRNGIEGIIVSINGWAELAGALKLLLANPARAQALGQNARARAITHYSQDAAADLYAKLYRTVVHRCEEFNRHTMGATS